MPKRPLPAPGVPGETYLIHLDAPVAHARHYTGWSADAPARDSRYRNGNGARLLAVARERGITWQVVRTWPGTDRRFERRLKNYAGARYLCPVCNPGSWHRRVPGNDDEQES